MAPKLRLRGLMAVAEWPWMGLRAKRADRYFAEVEITETRGGFRTS
jgi:hypothetical protein